MTTEPQRHPVEGITVGCERMTENEPYPFVIYSPSGKEMEACNADELKAYGIPVPKPPKPPRTGPGGVSEDGIRGLSRWPIVGNNPELRARDFGIYAARDLVAKWDADDAAEAAR